MNEKGWSWVYNISRMLAFIWLWDYGKIGEAFAFALFSICQEISWLRLSKVKETEQ